MKDWKSFLRFAGKVALIHTSTYIIFGLIFSNLFNYKELYSMKPISDFMRPIDSPWVFAGPFLQPIRGLIIAAALWPFRQLIFAKSNGWLLLWGLFAAFGILSPPAAAPCSIEGIIYSKLPLRYHLLGLPEVMLQTLTFSLALFGWERKKALASTNNPVMLQVIQIFRAFVIGCYAYIGYAVGSLLTLLISSIRIESGTIATLETASTINDNIQTSSINLKLQLMFIVALLINVFCIYLFNRRNDQKPVSNRFLFLFFWTVDTMVPFLYHSFILGGVPAFHYTLLMGFFPAVIIWLSLKSQKGVNSNG